MKQGGTADDIYARIMPSDNDICWIYVGLSDVLPE